jgi:nitrite reductase/ring-hydroxylating ferredoxin subunit
MAKAKTPYDQDDDEGESDKRGVFKRMRDKVSTTFGSSRKEDDSDDEQNTKARIVPSSLDAIRLRLAMAMSGLSNLELFRFTKDEWVVACPKTRVGPGQITPCVVNGLDIIIFASRDGQRLDAFANACPHLGSPFDLATIERKPVAEDKGKKDDGTGDGCVDCIVCPVHRTAFEIQSGQASGEWCPYPPILGGIMGFMKPKSSLVKFAVRLRGKNVEVRIATSVKNVGKGDEQANGVQGIK